MDGFKKLPKMKTGGSVCEAVKKCGGGAMKKGGKYKEGGDIKEDKALIKKAFKQHDEAEHDKEPTEIKLKHGGRSKKAEGSVKKYKSGGAIEMKKSSGDLDTIKKVKATGAKKAAAPSKAEAKPAFKASDVEKEKSKPAGDKDAIKKVKPTGDKKADAPNKAAVKPNRKGEDAVDDIDGMKKGHAVKKYKAGGKIKHFVGGGVTGLPMPAPAPAMGQGAISDNERLLLQRLMQQKAGMQQSGMGNGMPTNPMQAPAPAAAPAPQQGPYSQQDIDAVLRSMAQKGMFSHTGD